jgi:hypothetical protein
MSAVFFVHLCIVAIHACTYEVQVDKSSRICCLFLSNSRRKIIPAFLSLRANIMFIDQHFSIHGNREPGLCYRWSNPVSRSGRNKHMRSRCVVPDGTQTNTFVAATHKQHSANLLVI